jgi:hypothetical protein
LVIRESLLRTLLANCVIASAIADFFAEPTAVASEGNAAFALGRIHVFTLINTRVKCEITTRDVKASQQL